VLRQSTRLEAYRAALDRLSANGQLRNCTCTRAALAALPANQRPDARDELFHPPECLPDAGIAAKGAALRFRVPDRDVEFVDRVQGLRVFNVARCVGDFVLRRRDGLFAYQLAVVVDDGEQRISDVVRGADLLSSTPRQILLQQALGLPLLTYMHIPLAVGRDGLKLSKSEDAPGLTLAAPARLAVAALEFLGQEPPSELAGDGVAAVWDWAVTHWRPERMAGLGSRMAPAAL
jgi:glutamyl-Q tRNA(Asp) synthetase